MLVTEEISVVFTALYGVDPVPGDADVFCPTILFKLELETLRAGVGGGGGFTDGGLGGATVGRPIGGFGAMRKPLLFIASCD